MYCFYKTNDKILKHKNKNHGYILVNSIFYHQFFFSLNVNLLRFYENFNKKNKISI